MSLNGNSPDLVYFAGRQKYFARGKKLYAIWVGFRNRQRCLRQSACTATRAEEYGHQVVARYKRYLAIAAQPQPKAKKPTQKAVIRKKKHAPK